MNADIMFINVIALQYAILNERRKLREKKPQTQKKNVFNNAMYFCNPKIILIKNNKKNLN